MVLRENFAKEAEVENTPPTRAQYKKSLLTRVNESKTKRRGGVSTRPQKYSVDYSKRRNDAKSKSTLLKFNVTTIPPFPNVEMANANPTPSGPITIPVNLPKELLRPEFKEISIETLLSIDPSAEGSDIDYLRDGFQDVSIELTKGLMSVKCHPDNKLPKELSVVVNDMNAILPSHMLAVFGKQTTPSKPRKVTLFPVHSMVLALHCANLPKPPPPATLPLAESGPQDINLRVWSLVLPSPITYVQLSSYLYTKNVDGLLKSMLPCSPPGAFMDDEAQLLPFARHLSETYTVQALLKHALAVHGLYQNACVLGVFDPSLWDAMDSMWQVLLTSMAISTNNPSLMITPNSPAPAEKL